ncbi:MAG TPA: glycosyltransferase family A protein, partial [bacterium]|nr:glycosyltransferase family A protein [bacterium]
TGAFLAFLDADDYWPPVKLEIQARALAEDSELDMVFGQVRHFFSPELDESERSKLQCPEELMAGYVPGTLLIRRSTLLQVGLFNPELRAGEFIEWFDRAQAMGLKSRLLPETLLFRRIHRDNFGRREKHRRQDYLKVVKAALDRRRKTVQG